MKCNILHILPMIGPKAFGIDQVARNLCREQREFGFDARIWCLDLDSEEDLRYDRLSCDLSDAIVKFPRSWPRLLRYSLAMERAVSGDTGREMSIVHQHGIWSGVSRTTNIMRQRYGTPTIVANVAVNARTDLNKLFAFLRNGLAARHPALKNAQPVYRDFRAGDVMHYQADISKARLLLGYLPTHTILQGLDEALEWYEGKFRC